MWLDKYLKSAVSEHLLTVNLLKGHKHAWNLHGNTFMMLEMPLLVTLEILGMFVNTLTAGGKYPFSNCKNLMLPIQMQLCKKWKTFFLIFCSIWGI